MLQIDSAVFPEDVLVSMELLVKNKQQAQVETKEGKVILLSEQEFRNMVATLEIDANPEMSKKILEGMATPLCDCLSENEVEW